MSIVDVSQRTVRRSDVHGRGSCLSPMAISKASLASGVLIVDLITSLSAGVSDGYGQGKVVFVPRASAILL